MNEVVFLAAGEADLFAHYDRLEAAQPGGGESFSAALDDGLALIARHPFLARAHRGNIRRFILSRYCLGVFYTVEGRRILVCRILDLRQSPELIARFLEPFD